MVKEYFTTKNYFYHIKFWYGKNIKEPLSFKCNERGKSMDFKELKNFQFYLSLGYVVLISSIITIIFMEIIKIILKKKKVIVEEMDATKKDILLTKIGRFIALFVYCIVYLLNELILKNAIQFNETLMVGILSGGAMTLTVAKGLYTTFRQNQKKKKVFEKLSEAEEKLAKLQEACLQQNKIILTRKEK